MLTIKIFKYGPNYGHILTLKYKSAPETKPTHISYAVHLARILIMYPLPTQLSNAFSP